MTLTGSLLSSPLTWHADASEGARVVEAGPVVLAGVGLALVDVGLAARAREALRAVAGEGARGVDTDAVVLARRTCNSRTMVSWTKQRTVYNVST